MTEDKKEFNGLSYPNVFMYVAWFNHFFKIRIAYNKKEKKFSPETEFKKDLGNYFLCGLNVE